MHQEQQTATPSRRTRSAKKSLRKKMVFSCALALLAGTSQVYAAVALNSSLVSLIKGGVESLGNFYADTADKDSAVLENTYKAQVQQSVEDAKASADSQLAQHTSDELARAGRELSAYVNDRKQEINSTVNQQVEASKTTITSRVNDNIAAIKQRIDQEFEAQINNTFKK